MNSENNISICIVTHNRPDLLRRLLAELAGCQLLNSGVRTLVVENGGCRESEEVAREASERLHVEHLKCSSPTKCAALNVALQHLQRGLVMFIDDDALPGHEWIPAYADAYRRHGRGHYFGGPITPEYDQPPPDWLRRFLPDSAVGFDASGIPEQRRTSLAFLGFNWAADVEDLIACGGFSEYFGPGTELGGGDETFMQYHLREAGCESVYVPQARVSHYVPTRRCSREWSLRRSHLAAICHGIVHAHYQSTHNLPPQRVRAIARFLRRRSSWGDVFSLCRLQPAGRYWLRYWLASGRGYWKGIERGIQDAPLTEKQWMMHGLGRSSSNSEPLRPTEVDV